MSVSDYESITSVDFGVSNKCYQVGKFANVNNGGQPVIVHFSFEVLLSFGSLQSL